MATRLDVQLDKSGVDQGLKQTAEQIKGIDTAAKQATASSAKLASDAARMASRQTAAWVEGARAIDDFLTVATSGQGFFAGIRAAANNITTMVTAMNPMAGIIAAVGLNVGSVLIPRLDEWLGISETIKGVMEEMIPVFREQRMEVERQIEYEKQLQRIKEQQLFTDRQFATIAKEYEESRSKEFQHLNRVQEVSSMIVGIKKTMAGLANEGNLSAQLQEEFENAINGLLQRRSEILDAQAEKQKEMQRQSEAAVSLGKMSADDERKKWFDVTLDRITSEEELDAMIEERSRKAKAFADQGRLDQNFEKRLAEEINAIIRRRSELVTEVAEAKRQQAREEEQEAQRLHREEVARIRRESSERKRAAEEQAREEERLRREKERQTQQDAKELLDADPALKDTLSGANQSKEDIARQVGRNRADRAVEGFLEDADMSRYRSVEERDRKIRQIRDTAERQGFRDTMSGRASEDEIMAARQENARATVSTVAKNAGLSENTVSALAEATRQIQNTESDLARQEAELERIRAALNSNGNAAQRRRSQRNSFRQ